MGEKDFGDPNDVRPSFAMGEPAEDLTHALQLAAAMDDEDIVAKLQRGA